MESHCFSYGTAYVVVLTVTRITKSVVTGPAPATLGWKNTPGEKTQTQTKTKVLAHACITTDATNASARKI